MREQQSMQDPSLMPPSRGDKDHGAGRCTQHRCRNAAKCARPKIRPNLRTHHNYSSMAFSGFFDYGRRSRARPVLNYVPWHIFTRELHPLDERRGC